MATITPIEKLHLVSEITAIIAKYVADAVDSAKVSQEANGKKNEYKVKAYANVIAGLERLKILAGSKRAGEFKAELIKCGVSPACAKRLVENGQKARKVRWIKKAAGSDADAILAAFAENNVSTEQDLVNIVCPKPVLTAAEELAAKASSLTDSDDDAVQALRDALAMITAAAAAPLDLAA
jgi:hypothetical protein